MAKTVVSLRTPHDRMPIVRADIVGKRCHMRRLGDWVYLHELTLKPKAGELGLDLESTRI